MKMFEEYLNTLKNSGRKIIYNDFGFAIYTMLKNECLIGDCFIKEEFRGTGKFKEMYSKIEEDAKKLGLKYITTHTTIDNKVSIETSVSLGFSIKSYKDNYVYLVKELK